jgi:3-hydroxyisobutyrate dehydrogenase-like beta-hydroxyacid dehydrogenase
MTDPPARARGGPKRGRWRGVGHGADVVITMLPTAPIVLDVVEPLLEDWSEATI